MAGRAEWDHDTGVDREREPGARARRGAALERPESAAFGFAASDVERDPDAVEPLAERRAVLRVIVNQQAAAQLVHRALNPGGSAPDERGSAHLERLMPNRPVREQPRA